MTDIMLIWDTPILFEKLFKEHGIKCMRALSSSIGTPFLPPCKCVVIPTGFANPEYTKITSGIEKSKRPFEKFVENGGTIAVFGPMISEYTYEWLPINLKYIHEHGLTTVEMLDEHEAQCIAQDSDQEIECDGYFSETEDKVLIKNADGQPVMVIKEIGKGRIIATTIHEFPSPEFIKWLSKGEKKIKL